MTQEQSAIYSDPRVTYTLPEDIPPQMELGMLLLNKSSVREACGLTDSFWGYWLITGIQHPFGHIVAMAFGISPYQARTYAEVFSGFAQAVYALDMPPTEESFRYTERIVQDVQLRTDIASALVTQLEAQPCDGWTLTHEKLNDRYTDLLQAKLNEYNLNIETAEHEGRSLTSNENTKRALSEDELQPHFSNNLVRQELANANIVWEEIPQGYGNPREYSLSFPEGSLPSPDTSHTGIQYDANSRRYTINDTGALLTYLREELGADIQYPAFEIPDDTMNEYIEFVLWIRDHKMPQRMYPPNYSRWWNKPLEDVLPPDRVEAAKRFIEAELETIIKPDTTNTISDGNIIAANLPDDWLQSSSGDASVTEIDSRGS